MNTKLLDELVKNGNCFDKMNCVDLKYGLDVLVHEEGFGIREYIASKGYCLDILVNDTSMDVRREVAKQGYGLNILVGDAFSDVKNAVLEHNYGLEKLAEDENCIIAADAQARINLQKVMADKKSLKPLDSFLFS